MILNEYITDKEISCGCGCGLKSPRRIVEMLYAVRLIMGLPIGVTSAIRCSKHNAAVGGAVDSAHLDKWVDRGAFDVVVISGKDHGMYEYKLIQVCQFVGFTGIGIKDNTFLHIDNVHCVPVVWGY